MEAMMPTDAIEDDLARRFRIDPPLTLLARKSSKARIGFSHMRSSRPIRGHSIAAPPEEAFAFWVPLSVPFFSNLWTEGRRREVPDLRLGDAQLVDLGDQPVVSLDIPFDSLRFYITQVALDEMANEAGIRRVKGLYAPNFGARDLVMFGLAQALAGAMEQSGDGTAMFSDCIALAFFTHIVCSYGSVPIGGPNARGGLAAWQLQRAVTSSMSIWHTIFRSQRSRMSADCRAATLRGRLNGRRVFRRTSARPKCASSAPKNS
jgi:AraC family transcriptional regulator